MTFKRKVLPGETDKEALQKAKDALLENQEDVEVQVKKKTAKKKTKKKASRRKAKVVPPYSPDVIAVCDDLNDNMAQIGRELNEAGGRGSQFEGQLLLLHKCLQQSLQVCETIREVDNLLTENRSA